MEGGGGAGRRAAGRRLVSAGELEGGGEGGRVALVRREEEEEERVFAAMASKERLRTIDSALIVARFTSSFALWAATMDPAATIPAGTEWCARAGDFEGRLGGGGH
jgi:hypothetical protein